MKTIVIQSARVGHSDCSRCGMRDMVLFAQLTEADFEQMHAPIDDLEIAADTVITQQGEPATHLFTVRSGLLKIVRLNADGSQRILRLLRPGDLAGIEASLSGAYEHTIVSLTKARLCRIPLRTIQDLQAGSDALRQSLLEKWAAALRESETWFADMNTGPARQRVARLLLAMRHKDAAHMSLLFKREDMGAMLDLTLETASRVISSFIREGLIARPDAAHGPVRLLDPHALQAVAEGA